jgi:hypothetical protein
MSNQTQQPPLRPGDHVRYIYDLGHLEVVESCRFATEAAVSHWQAVTVWDDDRRVAAASEFVIALPYPNKGGPHIDEVSFADRYGANVTEAAMGVTQATFIDTVRCTLEIVAQASSQAGKLSAAEARFLETRDRILARRNPELLERENAEFEAMTDAELDAIARRPGGLRPVDLDGLAEATWEVFVGKMREAAGG